MGELRLDTDVVIVGAGPTGLMLANCLRRLGVECVIVDGKSGPTRESRAIVLQARTLELYDQLGLSARVLAEAARAGSIVPGYERRRFRAVNLRGLAEGITPFPHVYVLEQSRNERLLVESLRAEGGEVRWGHRMVELSTSAEGEVAVVCETRDPAGGPAPRVTITARYCVGADGASSPVREAAGIPFTGITNEHTFYVADAEGVRGLVAESVNLRFGDTEFLLAFPMAGAGHHRLIGVVRAAPEEEVAEGPVRRILAEVFGVTYDRASWFSTYRVHHRVAADFRAGRVFLAGDAAHVHSPVGAQGMNTGLQDAHNLACKLADVIVRGAAEPYLDRYGAERMPVARRLVRTTDTVFGIVTSDRRGPRMLRRWALPAVAPLAVGVVPRLPGASRLFQYLSQTRIHYWMSEGARTAAHGRRGRVVGRRLPWNGDNTTRSATCGGRCTSTVRWMPRASPTCVHTRICRCRTSPWCAADGCGRAGAISCAPMASSRRQALWAGRPPASVPRCRSRCARRLDEGTLMYLSRASRPH